MVYLGDTRAHHFCNRAFLLAGHTRLLLAQDRYDEGGSGNRNYNVHR